MKFIGLGKAKVLQVSEQEERRDNKIFSLYE